MTTMRTCNYIIAAVAAAIGCAICVASWDMEPVYEGGDPGAGFWPLLIGGGLIVLAFLLAIFSTANSMLEKAKTIALAARGNYVAYAFMGLTVLFCLALYFLGFVLSGLLFIPGAMFLMGETSKKRMIRASILIVASIYIVFSVLLKTPLPLPLFLR